MKIVFKPNSQIKKRLGIDPRGPVQKFFTDTCANHMDKYVPMDTGVLAGTTEKGLDYVKYIQIYAHYQWTGISKNGKPFNYSHDKHPYAGDHWDKRMVSAEMDEVIKEVQRYVNKRKWFENKQIKRLFV